MYSQTTSISINGLALENSQIHSIKMYVSIQRGTYKMQESSTNNQINFAKNIVGFMKSVYLTEHPFDELDLCSNLLSDAEHVVNTVMPKSDAIDKLIEISIDFDNMLSLNDSHFTDYQSDSLTLTNSQRQLISDKQQTVISNHSLSSDNLLVGGAIFSNEVARIKSGETVKEKETIAVKQYDLNGNLIAEYDDIDDAVEATETPRKKIKAVCNYKLPKYKDSIFRYADDDSVVTPYVTTKEPPKRDRKKVRKYDLDGNLIEVFESMTDAANSVGHNTTHISLCCHHKHRSAYGFIWRFDEDESSVNET